MKKTIVSILFLIFLGVLDTASAQEIDFSKYDNYSLTTTKLSDLDFGFVINNSGLHEIDLGSPDKSTISITGINYLDITVELDAGIELLLNGNSSYSGDPNKSIPFTMQAAYANQGENNTSHAKLININSSNYGSVRFPIRARETTAPGPPPTPPHENYSPPQETAYIYIYGSIDIGQVDAGSYVTNLAITITYN